MGKLLGILCMCSVTATFAGVLSQTVVTSLKSATVKRSPLSAAVDTRFGKLTRVLKFINLSVNYYEAYLPSLF